jgi:hypothetical protein
VVSEFTADGETIPQLVFRNAQDAAAECHQVGDRPYDDCEVDDMREIVVKYMYVVLDAADRSENVAAQLALEMIQHQVARIERSPTCQTLVEFCFDGLRYVHRGSWAFTVSMIGEPKCRAALTAAKQEHGDV